MRKKYISAWKLRVHLRLSGYLPVSIFSLFCVYLVYTVYVLILSGPGRMAVTNGLLYMMTQSSSYFLLYTPAMVILLSGLIDMGSYELLIFSRTDTRVKYECERISAIVTFVAVCTLCAIFTTTIVYLCVADSSTRWSDYCVYLRQTGFQMVHDNMLDASGLLVVTMQVSTLMLSFFALGAFMLLLQNLFAKKFVSVIVPLCVSFAIYLVLSCDLPGWLRQMLPDVYLFLPYFDSLTHWRIAVLYWIGILTILCAGIMLSAKYKDVMYNDYEKEYQ